MPVTAAMSESSANKLKSVANSLSDLGLDAANGGLVNPPKDDEPAPPVGTPSGRHLVLHSQHDQMSPNADMPGEIQR